MIIYQSHISGITSLGLNGFFEGWKHKISPEKHFEILKGSYKIIIAVENGKVIGFINAISDGVLTAYIPLLEVLPGYRNRGIAKNLVTKMLDELKDFYMIDLCCDENLIGFYTKFGFRSSNCMIKRNY
jgi:ribosomal protein S18 acetylase RimI-like enzyme